MTQTTQEQQTQSPRELSNLQWNVPNIEFHNFNDVREEVQYLEDLRIEPRKVKARDRGLGNSNEFDYDVVDLKALRFNSVGSVYVPGFGNLEMTQHSMRQLGAEMGVRWEKFFSKTPAEDIQRAVTTHLKYTRDNCLKKIIARRYSKDDEQKYKASDGLLRGFVSPTYTEIRDARMFDRISKVADPKMLEEQAFAFYSIKDKGSHYMLVSREPVDLITAQHSGGVVGNKQMGISANNIGDAAYFGIRIRNSEVGAYALSAEPYFVRFACSNGIIVGIKEERLLYRQHRGITDTELDKLIENMYTSLPERQQQIIDNSRKIHSITFDSDEKVKEEIDQFLVNQPKALKESIVKAYNEEPIPTAYGITQAIARVAMAARVNQDKQYDIEILAGKYMKAKLSN